MKKHLLLLLIFLSGPIAQAQSILYREDTLKKFIWPLLTDRPGISESPFPLDRGDIQVESGSNFELDNNPDLQRQSVTYFSTLIKYGLSDRFELRMQTEYMRNQAYDKLNDTYDKAVGWLPLMAGTKILLLKAKGIQPQISFIGYLKLSLATGIYQPHYTAPVLKLSAAHSLNDDLSLGYNMGAAWNGEDSNAGGLYSFYLNQTIFQKLGAFMELYGFFGPGYEPDHRVDTGFTYQVSNKVQIDFSGGVGFSDNSPDGFLNMGMAWRIYKP
jgi:hypothetical protein